MLQSVNFSISDIGFRRSLAILPRGNADAVFRRQFLRALYRAYRRPNALGRGHAAFEDASDQSRTHVAGPDHRDALHRRTATAGCCSATSTREVIAPSEAEETSAQYFAKTPLV
jgi:hypothetical protein